MSLINNEIQSLGQELGLAFPDLHINDAGSICITVKLYKGYNVVIKPIFADSRMLYSTMLRLNDKIVCEKWYGYDKKYKIFHNRQSLIQEISFLAKHTKITTIFVGKDSSSGSVIVDT
tara:strand:- start:332 stop:685 length:354 start_codon:yes stop_codon:yes gene_type:complete